MKAAPSAQAIGGPVDPLAHRLTSRPSSPTKVAIAHLRKRKLAVFCFLLLVLYFLLAGVSYLRLPGDARFLGEMFEELATRPLVTADGQPIGYYPPTLLALVDQTTGQPITPYWQETETQDTTEASNVHFIFGTDILGRSVFWKTLYAARMSLTIAFGAAVLAVSIGTILGAIAGYLGGLADVIIVWLFTTVASIPRILLVMAFAFALKQEIDVFGMSLDLRGMPMLILAMGLTSWVGLCRLIRGEIMKQKGMDYESAARAIGMGRFRILFRHLVPNVFYLVIIQFSILFPLFIHLEVILTYLGLGVDEGVSWGQMIKASMLELMRSPKVWWQLVGATIAVFGISLALNLFGDALRDALDPRLQNVSDK